MLKGLLFFYLADLVTGVDKFIGAVIFFGLVFAACSLIFYFISTEDHESENLAKTRNSAKKLGKIALIVCFVLGVIQAILPSKQVCYVIAGATTAEYIMQETKIGQEVSKDAVQLLGDVSHMIHKFAYSGEKLPSTDSTEVTVKK